MLFKRQLIVPPGSPEIPVKTVSNLLEDFERIVGASKKYVAGGQQQGREYLYKYLPSTQDELPARRMADSYDTAIIPLSSDLDLREKYMTFHNSVRIGRLLEDLDIFAVCLCYRHIDNPKQVEGLPSPYSIVTALVDQIDISEVPLRVSELSG